MLRNFHRQLLLIREMVLRDAAPCTCDAIAQEAMFSLLWRVRLILKRQREVSALGEEAFPLHCSTHFMLHLRFIYSL